MVARKKPTAAKMPAPSPVAQPGRSTARNFDAGHSGRRLRAIPSSTAAINTQIRTYGGTVVARSRYLAANNPYAMAAKDEFVSALVGTGIKPSSLADDLRAKKLIQETWFDWTDESDANNLTDLYGLQALIGSEMFEAGECFVRLHDRTGLGLVVPLQLQILPCEMLPTWHNEVLPGGRRIEMGIEFDAVGRRVAYHFLRNHPGETQIANFGPSDRVRVPAGEVLHLFRPIRAGQIRGIPHTLAGIITLAMLDLYDDAELERKRTAALFAAFVKRPRGDEEEDPFGIASEFEPSDFSLEPGAVIDLLEGQEISFAEPADVGTNYESFQYRMLLRAAAGFGVPYAAMTGDLRQTSYGSIRAGLVAFRRRVEAMQHSVMVFQFCRPVWQRWFLEAVAAGVIPSTSRRVKWIAPKWEWIDPLKDRQAEKLAVDSGFKSRGDVIEAEGYDPEQVDARIKADQQRASGLGIKFITLPSSIIVAPDDERPTADELDFG